jgi:hypothetical protein
MEGKARRPSFRKREKQEQEILHPQLGETRRAEDLQRQPGHRPNSIDYEQQSNHPINNFINKAGTAIEIACQEF